MLYGTFMIGVIPFVVVSGIYLNREEHKFQSISAEINQKRPTATAPISTKKEATIFEIPLPQIRYVEALQNYIKIGFVSAEGTITEQVERATLKHFAEQAKNTSMVRCHRSFMVNQETIISSTGNAQGLQLRLADCDKVIPVSRSRVAQFR
ncbi:MAG: LytR/AlgR family response regulator transcription factor, partial [Saprospiraceae bacterium]